MPLHVLFMYCPCCGHVRLHWAHCVSRSMLHSAETNLCWPHVSLHAAHVEYLSAAQSLLMKLTPETQGLGQTLHSTVLFVPDPVQGGPAATCLGGQSDWTVHLAHP